MKFLNLKIVAWCLLVVFCAIDNLTTSYLLSFPGFGEFNPWVNLWLKFPGGLHLSKLFVLGLMILRRNQISLSMLFLLNCGMFLVCVNNLILFCFFRVT